MEEIKCYKAIDGNIFNTEKECIAHEDFLKSKSKKTQENKLIEKFIDFITYTKRANRNEIADISTNYTRVISDILDYKTINELEILIYEIKSLRSTHKTVIEVV